MEVCDHPALKNAEQKTRANTPEHPSDDEQRNARGHGEEAREGIRHTEELARLLASIFVRKRAGNISAHSAGYEASGEERRDKVRPQVKFFSIKRV